MPNFKDEVDKSERELPLRKRLGRNCRYTRMFQRINKAAKHHLRQMTKRFIRQTQEEEE